MPSALVAITNLTRPSAKKLTVKLCNTFITRFRGLMLVPSILPESGVLIDEQSDSIAGTSIHMLFMNFDIAVVWINSQLQVVDARIAKRWRPMYAPAKPARYVLELHPDRLPDFQPGDKVDIRNA